MGKTQKQKHRRSESESESDRESETHNNRKYWFVWMNEWMGKNTGYYPL